MKNCLPTCIKCEALSRRKIDPKFIRRIFSEIRKLLAIENKNKAF